MRVAEVPIKLKLVFVPLSAYLREQQIACVGPDPSVELARVPESYRHLRQ